MDSVYEFGYSFYQITFAVVLCTLPYFFLKYVICCILIYIIYRGVQSCRISLSSRRFDCQGRGVIITGCDSGFGHAFAKHLHELGFTVFAGCFRVTSEGARLLESTCSDRLHVLQLDVTSDRDITAVKEYVEQNLPTRGLCGIVNNAGRNHYGEIEFLTVDRYHGLLDVNLWGYVRVTKAFLPLVRGTKGRIVMVSSVMGRMYWSPMSTYSVSKVGIETIADSLRLEMMKFGVKVILMEPGGFGNATSIVDVNQVVMYRKEVSEMWDEAPKHVKEAYGHDHVMSWVPKADGGMGSRGDIRPVMRAIELALTSGAPMSRYLVPGTAAVVDIYAMLAVFTGLLPTWMVDMYVTYKSGCDQL